MNKEDIKKIMHYAAVQALSSIPQGTFIDQGRRLTNEQLESIYGNWDAVTVHGLKDIFAAE